MNSDQISQYFTQLASQTPVLLALVAALLIVILKWKSGASGSVWALVGLSIWLVSVLAVPAVSVAIQKMSVTSRSSYYTISAAFWSFVRAASLLCLLVAVFAGRTRPSASPLPPFPKNSSAP